ncbi:MAG TPA: DNA polymerase I [bacterium]|nr:DNA polymerase I [bacterium]HPN44999.1 DNA polymerase I [bacterium]
MSQTKKKPRLFLIDGMALAYRSYFAFMRNPLTNSRGENVSVVYGFTNIILNILDREKPDYFAVVFDSKEPTFRHEMYAEYKAQRAEMPGDMIDQLPRIQQMLEILRVPKIAKPGFEADDIIGTLARMAEKESILTVIVTGDKDLMQLVSPDIIIYNPKKSGEEPEWLDEKGVQDKIGLPPNRVIDYLALTGDTSDNIPGVPGIGPKTALLLLQEFDTFENVLHNIDNVKNNRARTSLQENGELAKLSRKLVEIDCNVPVAVKPTDFVVGTPDPEQAVAFFSDMEFRTLTERFAPAKPQTVRNYILTNSEAALTELADKLAKSGSFAFDTETTDIDPIRASLVGISVSCEPGTAYYIPVRGPVDLMNEDKVLPLNKVRETLQPVFADDKVIKCAHNAKYDILVLERHGFRINGFDFDTMVASYLLNPSLRQHNLDGLSLSFLNLKKIPTSALIGSGTKQITMDQAPVAKVSEYACEDADVTWRLRGIFEPKLHDQNLYDLFRDVEMPLVDVLKIVEYNGVALDVKYLTAMSRELEGELKQLESKIYRLSGGEFNIQSPKQLAEILFERLKLPTSRKTKTGYSTDVSVLEELALQHELPAVLLDYRQLAKLKSTYVDALPKLVNPATGRVHTSYNQTVAATGRLSSSDPNLQNIPIRTEIGSRIRKAFITRDADHIILDADYSQIELRIMAHLSGDKTLRQSFVNEEDVHTRTAALVFHVNPNEVTPEQRRKAKEVNFGIMYGMGAYGLAQRLGISNGEADEFIKTYFASYPGVYEFMQNIKKTAAEKGYVTTLLNRRRYLPEINSDNRQIREFAERTAINTPIQGSAADMIKVAMLNIQKRLTAERLASKMIMQVHDELVFETPKTELEYMQRLVQQEMENALKLDVPVKVEMGQGANWLEAHS